MADLGLRGAAEGQGVAGAGAAGAAGPEGGSWAGAAEA